MKCDNSQNLKSFSEYSAEKAFEIRSKGGKAGAEAKKRRKTQREYLQQALDLKVSDVPALKKLGVKLGLNLDETTLQQLLTLKLLLNTAQISDISKLKDVTTLLGEQNETSENNGILNDLTEYLKGGKDNVK